MDDTRFCLASVYACLHAMECRGWKRCGGGSGQNSREGSVLCCVCVPYFYLAFFLLVIFSPLLIFGRGSVGYCC